MRPFEYQRAQSAQDAIHAALAGKIDSRFIAGGTTLLDLMKLDVMQPERLVDISGIGEDGIALDGDGLHLGGLARMADVADHPDIGRDYPVIAQSLAFAASGQLRNMARLGGNLLQRTRCPYFRDPSWTACNKRNPGSGCAALQGISRGQAVLGTSEQCIATYPGDFAQALIALDAVLDIAGASGARTLPIAALHCRPGDDPSIETTLEAGEIITAIHVPAGPWTRRSLYLKVRDRESYAFALASAAVALEMDGDEVKSARIALGGVATTPWRAAEAEAALAGRRLDETTAAQAARAAFASAQAQPDNRFKIELGRRTLVRALLQCAALGAELEI